MVEHPERTAAARWLALAIGSLVLAGTLSILLVIGRMPPFDRLVTDPMFFRRCLVVHVDLALVVCFSALTCATSYAVAPDGLSASARYELANWGGGHVLQLAISCALATTWIVLVGGALGKSPIGRPASFAIFAIGLAPWLAAPILAA